MAVVDSPKRIALSLGSGGARGYAHIGVIEEIEKRGWEIIGIAGSSMGAVVGGLYAAGGMTAYADWAKELTRRDVLRLMDPTVRGAGLLRASKVMSVVREHINDARIDDLPMPFTAVAVDLLTQREVWFTSGPLIEAMRASFAIPSVFTPLETKGMVLADGGLLNPVPVVPLADLHADAIIAVNLSGATMGEPLQDEPVGGLRLPKFKLPAMPQMMEPALRALMPGQRRHEDDPVPAKGININTLEVVDRSLHLMQATIRRYRLAGYPPDVLVDVPHDACGTMDFHRAESMIELGRQRASEAFDAWENGAPVKI